MSFHAAERPWPGLLVRRGLERRSAVLVTALLMLAGLFLATRAVSDPAPGIAVLAVLPVTLLGLELGLTGGLAAAALAVSLLAINAAGDHPDIGLIGVATRAVAFFAVGGVAGRFSDRMHSAYAREDRLLRSGLELGGSLAEQRLAEAVARAAARMPGVDGVRVHLDGLPSAEAGTVGEDPPLVLAVTARGIAVGRLEVAARGRMGLEERAGLELLALQAGLAADNRRLLARERERAGIEAELVRVRDQLTEHRSGLEHVLSSQERERATIAHRLHEDLTQILSAVLMGLRLLDRETPEQRAAMVSDLRGQITDVLRELRAVAGTLRPPSLSQLGLRAALEALAADGRLALELDDAGPLPQAVETAVYRIVQDALAACHGDGRVGVRLQAAAGGVELELRMPAACRSAVLPAIRARAEAASGRTSLPADGAVRVRLAVPAHT